MKWTIWTTVCSLLALSGGATSAFAASADPCATPPPTVAAAVAREPGWSLVRLESLDADDLALWNANRPHACPGFAAARLSVGREVAYAVALLRITPHGRQGDVFLLLSAGERTQQRVLVEPYSVTNPAVVRRTGPGETQAWDGGPKIKIATDSIIVETMEAAAEQFFFVHGQLKSIVTSD